MITVEEIAKSLESDRTKNNVNRLVSRMMTEGCDVLQYIRSIESYSLPVKWYLSWTLNHYAETKKGLELEVQKELWPLIESTSHEGMTRDYWKILSTIPVHEEIAGKVYETALNLFPSQLYPVAVRVYALQTAYNIATVYPELMMEVREIMLELKQYETSGMWARLKNLLKASERIVREG